MVLLALHDFGEEKPRLSTFSHAENRLKKKLGDFKILKFSLKKRKSVQGRSNFGCITPVLSYEFGRRQERPGNSGGFSRFGPNPCSEFEFQFSP
jgi:hypothetical protein